MLHANRTLHADQPRYTNNRYGLIHGSEGGKRANKQTKQHSEHELPNRPPELAVTKTQSSLGREKRRGGFGGLDSAQVDLSAEVSNSHLTHTDLTRHRSSSLTQRALHLSCSLLSHQSPPSIFGPFPPSPMSRNELIRNYANDLKNQEEECASVWVYCDELVLKKKSNLQRKALQRLSAQLRSRLILLLLARERRQRGGRERGIRAGIRGSLY